MNRRIAAALCLLGLPTACSSDGESTPSGTQGELTYWQDIAPVFAEHCNGCHREGGIAPFRLDNYEDAKAHAATIQYVTQERIMPPWAATSDGSCGEFSDSLALSDQQIADIGRWVEKGASAGTPANVEQPAVPTLKDATSFKTPLYTPVALGGALAEHDDYRCFLVDPQIQDNQFVTGYEVQPGTPAIVHHMVAMLVDGDKPAKDPEYGTNMERMQALDDASPGDGWPCFSGAGDGVDSDAALVVWAPGQGVVEYPNQAGVPITSKHKLVIQVHYNLAEIQGLSDQSELKLRIVPDVQNVGLFTLPDPFLGSIFGDSPEQLEPGKQSVKYSWQESYHELGFEGLDSVQLYGVMPHMHELGHKYRMTIGSGAGTADQCGADVQDWDFHWQRFYFYQQPVTLTPKSSISVTCDFDTSSRQEPVKPGWGTQNEMCLATLFVTVPRAVFGQ